MNAAPLEHALRVLGREATRLGIEALEPLGVTANEYDILETIDRYMHHPGRNALLASVAARKAQLSPSYGSQITFSLEERGYVRHSTGGTRLLTAKGIQLLEDCRAAVAPVNEHMRKYFTNLNIEDFISAFAEQTRKQE